MEITPLEGWISQQLGGGEPLRREQIEAHQVQMLRQTICWARRHSSFYQERLANVCENDFCGLEDLNEFPFTTADDLQQNSLRFLCVSQSEVERVVTLQTSGTSGAPKRLYFTAADQERTVDFFHHGMSSLVGSGDQVLILLPGEHPGSAGALLASGLLRLGAVGLIHGPVSEPGETLKVMAQSKIDVLVGLPVQVLALARHSGGKAAPRAVVLCSDHAPEAMRQELWRLWDCEVYTHYGMTEMGLGGGVECQAHFGYHLRELDLYFEIIEPHTGEPVGAGEMGEVVFTTLSRRGLPLIRYRTGDLSRFLLERCPCGTVLKTLEKVSGRIAGQIELGSAALTMADLDEALFPLEGLLDFDAGLEWTGAKERLHLKVYAGKDQMQGLGAAVYRALQTVPAVQAATHQGRLLLLVEMQPPGAAPARGTAKRAIVDLRQNGLGEVRIAKA
jgi:phenylacetate-coenzyme A ligase PaaK-like adenylate-forming protein